MLPITPLGNQIGCKNTFFLNVATKNEDFFSIFFDESDLYNAKVSFSVFIESRTSVVRQHEGDKEPAVALRVHEGDA